MQYKSSCMCMQFVTAKKIPTIFKKKKRKKKTNNRKRKETKLYTGPIWGWMQYQNPFNFKEKNRSFLQGEGKSVE